MNYYEFSIFQNFEAPFEVYSFNREPEEDDDLLEVSSEEEDELR